MKELSIEEKAKLYDSMFERLKEMYNNNKTNVADRLIYERYFPELKEKESEDERIRKRIIHALHGDVLEISEIKEAVDWLEKQGEHANFRNKIQIGDKVTRNEDGILVNLSQLNRVAKKDENQGEQETVESMSEFKEGDILYNRDSYVSSSIFIFKGMSDKTNAYLCYARLYGEKDFSVYSKEDWDKGNGVYGGEFYPANHKQKELLFSKMKEAGYEWDDEKKELKKIEQLQAIDYSDSIPKDNWELIHEFVNKFGRIPKDEDELNVLIEYVLKKKK